MKKITTLGFSIVSAILPTSCGRPSQNTVRSAPMALSELPPEKTQGTGFNEKSCTLEVTNKGPGMLPRVTLTGDFKVDYKIPAPGSGLYGTYYWPHTFDTEVNFKSGQWSLKRSLLGDADVLEGDGKPLFWDGGPLHHKLVFKPSLHAPQSVTYHSVERLISLVPFVVIDGKCNF